jgi:hypothetical protein
MSESLEWIFVDRPGLVPMRKGPYRALEDTVRALREVERHYPDCTTIVVDLDYSGWPRPTSGKEYLSINSSPETRSEDWPRDANGSPAVETEAVPQSAAKAVFNECECDSQIKRHCKFNTPNVPCDCLCHTLNRGVPHK